MRCQGNGRGETPDTRKRIRVTGFLPAFACAFLTFGVATGIPDVQARDAAFLPQGGSGASDVAVTVEPKEDIDIGDSVLNVARRVDLFFVNQTAAPVKVEKVTVSGDSSVATELTSDDCSKQGTIPPGSRCSVEASLTPSTPGPWTAEVLMTHDGAGRIARARLTGKTAGTISGEKKDMGLALSTKESTPVNFGDVAIGNGKVVRSALMVNDSTEPITLYSIDVIEASNGLEKLDQGCAVDMELKPGESCPVTLVWMPSNPGQVSTDLIIRHSGRLGFAVIPIRGVAKGEALTKGSSDIAEVSVTGVKSSVSGLPPPPPGASEVEKEVSGKIPAVSDKDLGTVTHTSSSSSTGFYLIGTVGNRAIIMKPDGKTVVANSGDDLDMGDDKREIKVVLVSAKSVDLLIEGKKKTLYLGSAPELIEKATLLLKVKSAKDKDMDFSAGSSSGSPSSSSSSSGGSGSGSGRGGSTTDSSVSGASK